jgi:ketosteroid isomerase-like protein
LDTLSPAERLAFVLHDMFGVPFVEIAVIVGRSPNAAKMPASRARRRLRGATAVPDADLARQRAVVDAFFAAARDGDFDALIAVLDPDVVVRADAGAVPVGAWRESAARRPWPSSTHHWWLREACPVRTAGAGERRRGRRPGSGGRPVAVMGFTIAGGKIVKIDVLADPSGSASSTCRCWATDALRRCWRCRGRRAPGRRAAQVP